MKEFIRRWSNWWILNPKRKQLDDAFEKELNELIEREVALRIHGSLPEHEKWSKISDAINKAKKKRQEQGFQLGVIKGGLYSMGFEDAIEWLLGNEL